MQHFCQHFGRDKGNRPNKQLRFVFPMSKSIAIKIDFPGYLLNARFMTIFIIAMLRTIFNIDLIIGRNCALHGTGTEMWKATLFFECLFYGINKSKKECWYLFNRRII